MTSPDGILCMGLTCFRRAMMAEFWATGLAPGKSVLRTEEVGVKDRVNNSAEGKHTSSFEKILLGPWSLEDKDARCPFRVQSIIVLGLARIAAGA